MPQAKLLRKVKYTRMKLNEKVVKQRKKKLTIHLEEINQKILGKERRLIRSLDRVKQ